MASDNSHIPIEVQVATRRGQNRAEEHTNTYVSSEISPQQSCSLKCKGYIHIEVAYAEEQRQAVIPLRILKGSSVLESIEQSRILQEYPCLQLNSHRVGIWGKQVSLSEPVVEEGARIEIYRPLLIDPKQARRKRTA